MGHIGEVRGLGTTLNTGLSVELFFLALIIMQPDTISTLW